MHIIYLLKDPVTNEIRYVGKSSKGLTRPKKHLLPCYYNNKRMFHFPIYRWIRKLVKKGHLPIIEIFQTFSDSYHLNQAEIYWISYFKSAGSPLLNSTAGGDGVVGNKWTEEQKKRLSEQRKNKIFSDEHKHNLKKVWQEARKNQNKKQFKSKVSNGIQLWLKNNPHIAEKTKLNLVPGSNRKYLIDQYGNKYKSCTEAAKKLGCSFSYVCKRVKEKKECLGYVFTEVKNA